MTIATMHDLFEHELKDIFYAENQLIDELGKLEKETELDILKTEFADHRKVTQNQVERLKNVFKLLKIPPTSVVCDGIEGIFKEKRSLAKEKPPQAILDYSNIVSAIKIERYEISAYESLVHIARDHIDKPEIATLLEETLDEEREALNTLLEIHAAHSEAHMGDEAK